VAAGRGDPAGASLERLQRHCAPRRRWRPLQRAQAREGFDFRPYCGHQIGAAVNERPRLVIYDQTPVQTGMVFAVEPGVYGGEELGVGARAERVVVVRESGNEILSAFTWGMEA